MEGTTKRSGLVMPLLAICLVCVLVGSRAFSQAPAAGAPSNSEVGRYQLTRMDTNSAYLLDTKTGRVWYKYTAGKEQWEEQSPPFIAKTTRP